MSDKLLEKNVIIDRFKAGFDCGQVVLGQWAEELGYDKEEAYRIAATFGGGMFRGDTCGAVLGAMVAIGMKYGHYQPNDDETKGLMLKKAADFQQKFTERCGSTICRELCGYDFAVPGELEKALAAGALFEYCPKPVTEALLALDEIM